MPYLSPAEWFPINLLMFIIAGLCVTMFSFVGNRFMKVVNIALLFFWVFWIGWNLSRMALEAP